jgi:chorismate synthase
MAGNSFGQLFRITTFGESHGGAVGVVVDGCPPGISITQAEIQKELDRRRPGQSAITTPRKEADEIHILSGYFEGKTTGTPLMMCAYNTDTRSEDYHHMNHAFRPGHADYTYIQKYGFRDWRGSGRASARETLARVAAGAIAQKYLREKYNIEIVSFVETVGDISATVDLDAVSRDACEVNDIRCPDGATAQKMIELVESVRDAGDSVGGVIRTVVRNVPAGLGEPVFDKLHADLGKGMLSINAVKGFEIGSGFAGVSLRGSTHNDLFVTHSDGTVHLATNHAGGVLGGISTGAPLMFRTAFKPVSTIRKSQETVHEDGSVVTIEGTGRHDPCVLPRAVPIVDAMTALVLMDHLLRQQSLS